MHRNLRMLSLSLLAVSIAVPALAQGSGADTYKSRCAMCHGADGLGATPTGKAMKVPSFTSPDLVKASDAELIAATKDGKGKMPAYKSSLSDAQIKAVIGYVRTLQK